MDWPISFSRSRFRSTRGTRREASWRRHGFLAVARQGVGVQKPQRLGEQGAKLRRAGAARAAINPLWRRIVGEGFIDRLQRLFCRRIDHGLSLALLVAWVPRSIANLLTMDQ